MTMTLLKPQELVAQQFMDHKGYSGIEPLDIEKVDGEPCWYFLYQLPEGRLELEVYWNGQSWETTVTTFGLTG